MSLSCLKPSSGFPSLHKEANLNSSPWLERIHELALTACPTTLPLPLCFSCSGLSVLQSDLVYLNTFTPPAPIFRMLCPLNSEWLVPSFLSFRSQYRCHLLGKAISNENSYAVTIRSLSNVFLFMSLSASPTKLHTGMSFCLFCSQSYPQNLGTIATKKKKCTNGWYILVTQVDDQWLKKSVLFEMDLEVWLG